MIFCPNETDEDRTLIRKFWLHMAIGVYLVAEANFSPKFYWLYAIGSLCALFNAWVCTEYLERKGEKQ